jgi:hypothetical protein
MVRAAIGEMMNNIPADKMIFSVTTDGFITNADDAEILEVQRGEVCDFFRQTRKKLTGDQTILVKKHHVKQVLGWKTRGQATLLPGILNEGASYVLAKAGIQPPPHKRETLEQNHYISDLFFKRIPEQKVVVDTNTSMRDMVFYYADLVKTTTTRKLNMEYDFKRKPLSVVPVKTYFDGVNYENIAFSTQPWETVGQFKSIRGMVDDYVKMKYNRQCIKTVQDYQKFAEYFDTRNSLSKKAQAYLRKKNGDLLRLKRDLCRAFKQGEAGLDSYTNKMTANEFVSLLNDVGFGKYGIKCKRLDVENAGRASFQRWTTPKTERVLEVIYRVKESLPFLDVDEFLSIPSEDILLLPSLRTSCFFTEKIRS